MAELTTSELAMVRLSLTQTEKLLEGFRDSGDSRPEYWQAQIDILNSAEHKLRSGTYVTINTGRQVA